MYQQSQNNAVKSWKRVLSTKEDIARLFKELGLDNYQDIKITSRTFSNDDRLIVAVDAVDPQGMASRVIVDATPGYPTWRQFINVTYESGKFTDTKIILYGENNRDYENPLAGGWRDLYYLTRYNNKCGVRTYLVKGIALDEDNQKLFTNREIVAKPDDVKFMPEVKHPSKAEVQKAEFWLGYYCQHCDDGEINIGMDDDIFGDWSLGYCVGQAGAETHMVWNDDGLFLKLIGKPGSETIRWIWENRKFTFEVLYLHCPVTFETDQYYCGISIRLEDIPLQDVFRMDPDEKSRYGRLVHDEEWKFFDVARKIAEDYDDNYLPTRQLLGRDTYEHIKRIANLERTTVPELIREYIRPKINEALKKYPFIIEGEE